MKLPKLCQYIDRNILRRLLSNLHSGCINTGTNGIYTSPHGEILMATFAVHEAPASNIETKKDHAETSNTTKTTSEILIRQIENDKSTEGSTNKIEDGRKFVDTTLSMFPVLDINGDNVLDKSELSTADQLAQKEGTELERRAIEVMVKNYNYLNQLEPSNGQGIKKETIWTAGEILNGERKPWTRTDHVNDSFGTGLGILSAVAATVTSGILTAAVANVGVSAVVGTGPLYMFTAPIVSGAAWTTGVAATGLAGYGIGLGIDYAIDRTRDYIDYNEHSKPVVDAFLKDAASMDSLHQAEHSTLTNDDKSLAKMAAEKNMTVDAFVERANGLFNRMGVPSDSCVSKQALLDAGNSDLTLRYSPEDQRTLNILVNQYERLSQLATIPEATNCVDRASMARLQDVASGKTELSSKIFKDSTDPNVDILTRGANFVAGEMSVYEGLEIVTHATPALLGASIVTTAMATFATGALMAKGVHMLNNYYTYKTQGKKDLNHLLHEFNGTGAVRQKLL